MMVIHKPPMGEGQMCPNLPPRRDTSSGFVTSVRNFPRKSTIFSEVTFPEHVSLHVPSSSGEGHVYTFSHLQTCLAVIHRLGSPRGQQWGDFDNVSLPMAVAA